jgi:hypothetical protein
MHIGPALRAESPTGSSTYRKDLESLTVGVVPGRFFTWRVNLYRLFIGALILAIVLPAQASGYQPLWSVVLAAVVFGIAVGILLSRIPRVGVWLRR